MPSAYPPIGEHGVIGDLHTVALIATDGTLDFLSFPKFDSPTVFAALLDTEQGGHFKLRPSLDDATHKQMYLPDTNVLITRHLSSDGVGEVSDFMPVGIYPHDHPRTLVRRVKTVRGDLEWDLEVSPRFGYGLSDHTVTTTPGETLFTSTGPDGTAFRIYHPVPLEVRADGSAVARFRLAAGETAAFVLEEAQPGMARPAADPDFVSQSFKDTVNYWRVWIGRSEYTGRWREIVNRSALVLKLLVSQTHGSLIAAATFGLPEELGGERNWDYRYTWIRDASFAIYGLIRLGFTEEAGAFMKWIEARCMEIEPDGSMQIMYGHDGRTLLTEETLDHWEGYDSSAPVRVGNGAYDQLQLDIYGELMDSVYLSNKYGEPISSALWENLQRLVEYVCLNWQSPDEGIWEVRGGQREFLYSRLMCWVAVDRGIRLAERRSFPYAFERWRQTRAEIYSDIFTNFWNSERECFVQYRGAAAVDASTLLMPLVKFISPTDPRWLSTLRVIEEDLVDDSLVFRYRGEHASDDGLMGSEGTFNLCSFWYAEVLACSGDVQKARFVYEKMLGYANHVGLYAEELGPHGEHLGNFPQAFTHLALISAAHAIDKRLSAAGWHG